jgi:UDP-glucose 4-epimerase
MHWVGEAYGFRGVVLRYFNVAGATARLGEVHRPETHLIPAMLVAAEGGAPLTLFGDDYPTPDGTPIRDYIHVEDLADAHVRALDALSMTGSCRAYNLGQGGEGYTVKEIIAAARTVTGRDIPTAVVPRRAGDPAVLIASSTRIARDLGWRPGKTLADIVTSAWQFMTVRTGAR